MAQASIAYGSINNFDTVNDTSNVCHGFEIELDDIHRHDSVLQFAALNTRDDRVAISIYAKIRKYVFLAR